MAEASEAGASAAGKLLNFNVGVLGHVDSGKTSLAKALSTTASTASFDKNPQSKERGITLDLGFSSFVVPLPDHLKDEPYDGLQFTLVDCPGHASLIKTIIGGAQIIDMMMLVVDITKGIQTQTAECLVIGEIACSNMLVVLNKIDLVPEAKRQATIEKMCKKLSKTLESSRMAGARIVPVAAKPGGPEAPESETALGVDSLIETLRSLVTVPHRLSTGPLLFSVDHCFAIRGQGTVMTGTLLSGAVAVGENVEISALKECRKVKSMQMFKKPVQKAIQGDRLGMCVTQFDPKLLERGLVCSPGSLPTLYAAVVAVRKVRYFKANVNSKSKFHITMGHETVMGRVSFFSQPVWPASASATAGAVVKTSGASSAAAAVATSSASASAAVGPDSTDPIKRLDSKDLVFDLDQEYVYQDDLLSSLPTATQTSGEASAGAQSDGAHSHLRPNPSPDEQWLLIEFERPVICPHKCLVIGSRLDADIHANMCRIAFHGRLVQSITDKAYAQSFLPRLKVFKMKFREGVVERMSDEYTVIGRSLFKKETNIQAFTGLKVTLSTGEVGVLDGGFGQSGKFKVRIPGGLKAETVQTLVASQKKKGKGKGGADASADANPSPAAAAATGA
eukprot:scpid69785/ scgid6458/ Selenocysteine-specific elongation factor; Elongation factor sec; Eukaryotic elongation factor, selenocysteine-tRNA-specific